MTDIAFLGLGAMGSRMARRLIDAGRQVTVWNRTAAAAATLTQAGARLAATPKEAAAGAAFVIAMVRDDEASRQVWLDPETGALAGMSADAIAIESSTLTPGWVRELGQAVAAKGVGFIEAPVSGTLPQAESGQLVYLIGGEEAVWRKAEATLKSMGAAQHLVGALGAGALAKLCTNTLLGIQVATIAELIGLLERNGADAARVMKVVAATPVWSPVASRLLGSMLAGDFAPQFPVALIAKDFGYTLAEAGEPASAPTIAAALGVFREAIAKGMGEINMTGVVKLFAA